MKDNSEEKEKINIFDNSNIKNEIKYSLKVENNDNDLEYKILREKGNIINIQNYSNNETKGKKREINYALIIKNISNDVINTMHEKYFDDEFKINILLMSSLYDESIKYICIYFKYKFNENKNNYSVLRYILYKMEHQYNKNNKSILVKLFVYILKSYSEILLRKDIYFYPYYFLTKAKNLLSKIPDNTQELEEINALFPNILEHSNRYIRSKYDLFRDKKRMNEKKLNDINKILKDILMKNNCSSGDNNNNIINERGENNNKNSINDDNEEIGSYSLMISKSWIDKTKIFIDFYIISSREMMLDDLKNAFNEDYALYSFFKESKDKNDMNSLYPGPIDNYNLLKYRDFWEDDIDEDENYFLKDNLEINKDYYLTSQRNWNILNDIFGSTNEIKRNENCEFIEIKALILEKRFKKKVNNHLLRRRYIQIKNKCNIKKLKEKIIRCINNELKKKGADFSDYLDDEEDEYEHE